MDASWVLGAILVLFMFAAAKWYEDLDKRLYRCEKGIHILELCDLERREKERRNSFVEFHTERQSDGAT